MKILDTLVKHSQKFGREWFTMVILVSLYISEDQKQAMEQISKELEDCVRE